MDNSVKSPWMAALNHSSRKGMTSTAMDISRRGIQFGTVSLDQNSLSVATNSNTETGPGEAMEQESWTDTQTPRRVTSFESNIASPLARRYSQRSDFNAEAVPFRPQDNQPQGLNQNSNLPSVARYCGTVVHPVIHQDITTQAARHALKPFSDPSVQGIAAIDFATLRDFGTASLNQMRMSPNSARQNWYDPRVPERRTISLGSNSVEDVHGSSPWTPNSDRSLSGTFNSQRSDFNGPQSSHHRNRFGNHDNYHDSNSHRPSRRSSAYNSSQGDMNNGLQHTLFDPYGTSASPLPSHAQPHPAQINPYAQDHASNGTSSYYQAPQYSQPIQYHLYANFGPYKENLQPFQRAARDFFLPDALREELQRKSAATLQILPSGFSQSLIPSASKMIRFFFTSTY